MSLPNIQLSSVNPISVPSSPSNLNSCPNPVVYPNSSYGDIPDDQKINGLPILSPVQLEQNVTNTPESPVLGHPSPGPRIPSSMPGQNSDNSNSQIQMDSQAQIQMDSQAQMDSQMDPNQSNLIHQHEALTSTEIQRMAQGFGYSVSGSTVDQINMIRNRLGFEGVVDRMFFDETELMAILQYFNVPSYLPVSDQVKILRETLSSEIVVPGSPRIPGSPKFSPGSPVHSPIRARPSQFNLIELQKIAQRFNISTIGNEDTLIQNIRSQL